MVERAPPGQQRKALEVANLFVKMGIGFVPVPVASAQEFEELTRRSFARLDEMAEVSDSSPVGAQEKE